MLNKRDIKYIIKKVIIILIVALVFYFIRQVPIKADSLNQTITLVQNNRHFSNSISGSNFVFSYNLDSSFLSNIGTNYQITIENYTTSNFSSYNNYILFYNSTLKQYVVAKYENIDTLNLVYDDESGYFTSSLGISYLLYKYDENVPPMYGWNCNDSPTCFSSGSSYSPYYINTSDNKKIGIIQNMNYTSSFGDKIGLNLDYVIIDTNITNLTINNNPYVDYYPSIIPSNYQRLDLTNYQAVLITPKNYQTMISESSTTSESAPGVFNTYLNFQFYSQYCTRPTLINIENTKDMILNYNNIPLSGVSSIVGTCPQEPTKYSLSYQYDMYNGYPPYALLIYNNQIQDSDNWDTASTYMTSYVWYDINLYNYELISDVSSLDVNLSYKDFSGEDKSLIVEKLPTLNESFQYALDTYETSQTEESSFKQRINNFLDFIKSPFNFIYSLTQNSCTPLKAPFPHSNLDITLPCMSTIYENHLPQELLNILKLIINGLLFYRITLSNIGIVKNLLNPNRDKLEVLEL